MATQKVAVIVNGEIQALQSGDDISAPITGATEITLVNDNAGAIVIGTPVYMTAASHVDKAKADAAGTSTVIGLVAKTSIATTASGAVAVSGVLTATTTQWDAVAGTTGGLIFGTRYYLSAGTAGLLTATAPTTAGQYVQRVGIAISTIDMRLDIGPRILL